MRIFNFFKKKDNKIDVFAYCDKLFDEGNYQKAIKILEIAIETDPNNWYSYFRKGKCFQFMNNFERAIDEFKKGLIIEDNFDLNRGIGECFLMTEQWRSGKNAFLKAYSLLLDLETRQSSNIVNIYINPRDKANILNNLAIAFYNLNEFQEAVRCCEDGIKFDPNYSGNHRILGIILWENNNERGISLLKYAANLGDEMAKSFLNEIL
jgi:tetratricopeptide (TPR) repeat protein